MKKSLFLLIAISVLSLSVNAQDTKAQKKEERKEHRQMEAQEATYQAKQAFMGDNRNTAISSSGRLDGFSWFTYKKGNKVLTAYYDENSQLVGTIQHKTYADIPAKAKTDIAKWYKGYTPGLVLFYDDNEENITNLTLYGMDTGNQDSYFVELVNPATNQKVVVQVMTDGEVIYFARLV